MNAREELPFQPSPQPAQSSNSTNSNNSEAGGATSVGDAQEIVSSSSMRSIKLKTLPSPRQEGKTRVEPPRLRPEGQDVLLQPVRTPEDDKTFLGRRRLPGTRPWGLGRAGPLETVQRLLYPLHKANPSAGWPARSRNLDLRHAAKGVAAPTDAAVADVPARRNTARHRNLPKASSEAPEPAAAADDAQPKRYAYTVRQLLNQVLVLMQGILSLSWLKADDTRR